MSPAGTPVNFCDLVDLDEAARVVDELGVDRHYRIEGEPIRVTSRRVSTVWNTDQSVVTEVTEICRYGASLGQLVLSLEAYPEGRGDDWEIHSRAEPRPELGERAYFRQDSDYFILGAPAGNAYLVLLGAFYSGLDPQDAEAGMRRLLEPAIEQVPDAAALEGHVAGDRCDRFEEAAAEALAAPIDYTRLAQVDGSYACTYSALGTGSSASVSVDAGGAEEFVQSGYDPPEVDGLDDAWLISGAVVAVRGDDVIRVRLVGAGGSSSRDGDGDYSKDERFATKVIASLTG